MTSLLLIGNGNLPLEETGIVNAHGIRTQQFLEGLMGASSLDLIVLKDEVTHETMKLGGSTCTFVQKDDRKTLRNLFQDKKYDAVIGVNTLGAYTAAKVVPEHLPLWADLNGWVMAEAQAQAASMQSDAYIASRWEMEKAVLERADHLSVVSSPQKMATIGELASLGRLTGDLFGEDVVSVVENVCRPLEDWEQKKTAFLFRGKMLPEEAFVVLWLGGFNAWVDEETLFLALEKAMEQHPQLHFLATGGALSGIDEKSFPRFQKRIVASAYQDRYHLLGWIDREELSNLLHESDVGINVDRDCYETMFGARNRLNEMLRYELPMVTTSGSEIAQILHLDGAAIVAKSGDSDEIAHALLRLGDQMIRNRLQQAQKELLEQRFSAKITTECLRKWIENPRRLPGKASSSSLAAGWTYLRQRGPKAFLKKCLQKMF